MSSRKNINIGNKNYTELLEEKEKLKSHIIKLLSYENFVNIREFNRVLPKEELDKYIDYLVRSRIKTEDLSPKQQQSLVRLFKEIAFEQIDKNPSFTLQDLKVYDYDGQQADVSLFKDLIDVLPDLEERLIKLADNIDVKNKIKTVSIKYDKISLYVEYFNEEFNDCFKYFPKKNSITSENVDKANMLIDLLLFHQADDKAMENIAAYFSQKTELEIDLMTRYYEELSPENKKYFQEYFYKDDAGLKQSMNIFKHWEENVKSKHNLSFDEYTMLRVAHKLKDSQICSSKTNILEVMGYSNYRDMGNFLYKHNWEAMFEFARAKNIDEMKIFMETENLQDMIIKYENQNPIISLRRKSDQDKSFEDCVKDVFNYFHRLNKGGVTLSPHNKIKKEYVTGDILNEIKDIKSKNNADYRLLSSYLCYSKSFLGQKYDEKKMLNILRLIGSDEFKGFIDDAHGRLRFIERFILNKGLQPANLKECRAEILGLKNALIKALNTEFTIEKYITVSLRKTQAPRVIFSYKGFPCKVTFDSTGKIHTLF